MAYRIDNGRIGFEVLDNGGVSIFDTVKNREWRGRVPGWVTLSTDNGAMRIPLGTPGSVDSEPGRIEVLYHGPRDSRPFRMMVNFLLDENGLEIEIASLDSDLPLESVEFPAHLCAIPSGAPDSYLAIPYKQGVIIPARLDAGFMRFMHNQWKAISDIDRTVPFECGGLNMPWFGASSRGSDLYFRVQTASDCQLRVVGNMVVNDQGLAVDARNGETPGERISSLSPVWLSSHRALAYPRRLRIEASEDGYVGMAKRYLRDAKSGGRHVSFSEKIERNPLVERIIGAPDIKIYIYTNRPDTPYFRAWSEPILNGYSQVHTTFDQVGRMVGDLGALGIDRALVLLGGWNRAGYDREHVDMWPPAAGAGGAEGLDRASASAVGAGYLFALHDNYQDYYPDAPSYSEEYISKTPEGIPRKGGVWDGGQCRIICSAKAFEPAVRTLDAVTKATKVNSYYLDTTTAAGLYECYDSAHPVTREEDRENRKALLALLADRGLVVGGEGGSDWAVPLCAFFEGLPGGGIGYNGGIESATFGIAVPLFDLVYHDAVVCYWQHGQPYGREDHANHVLHDVLSAQPSSWSLVYDQWEDLKPLLSQSFALVSRLHRRTARESMVSHEYLSPDYALQRTVFSDGTTAIVNYGISTAAMEDGTVPPKGFDVNYPDGESVHGRLSRDIVTDTRR